MASAAASWLSAAPSAGGREIPVRAHRARRAALASSGFARCRGLQRYAGRTALLGCHWCPRAFVSPSSPRIAMTRLVVFGSGRGNLVVDNPHFSNVAGEPPKLPWRGRSYLSAFAALRALILSAVRKSALLSLI